jgi:sialate O-acetylesterase
MKSILIIIFIFLTNFISTAQVKLPRLISDNLILQRDKPAKIWGWASANEVINIDFKNLHFKTTADKKGNWSILIPSQKAGESGDILIKAINEIIIKNVIFGDIWLCSGQSNMEIDMNRLIDKYSDEIKAANYPNIRQFVVPDKYDFHEEKGDLSGGNWQIANPKNILSFSAVGYFFAKDIYEKYKIPIGIINAALGGSPAEAWISSDAIKTFPIHEAEYIKFKNDNLIKEIEEKDRNNSRQWYSQLNNSDEGLKNNWKSAATNFLDWETIDLPDSWINTKLGKTNGAVWFKKTINIPPNLVGQSARLYLGRIVDADSVFINGRFVGSTGYQYPPRRYVLTNDIFVEGQNTITVRVISNAGVGGFIKDKPYHIVFENDTISLLGAWHYKLGISMPPLAEQTFVRWKPVGLYNAMIAPLQNLAIKGVVWYQGESNTKNPSEYASLVKTLIECWRSKWNQGEFPFIIAQLPNFMETKTDPSESDWAALRQQQLNLLSVPYTGLSVNIDLGEWNDIHPFGKKEVGHRLALQAFKIAYGQPANTTSPFIESAKLKKNKVILTFKNSEKGLKTFNNQALFYFAVADETGKYVWANAKIAGTNKVVIATDIVKSPKSVRYAWADNPNAANLYNSSNLPASPFQINVK